MRTTRDMWRRWEWTLLLSAMLGSACSPPGAAGGPASVQAPPPPSGFQTATVSGSAGVDRVTLPRISYSFHPVQGGRSYYVSPSGSDAAAGTLAAPWATLKHAVAALKAGDVLYCRAGNYSEPFVINQSGTAAAPIVICAYSAERVTISQPSGWQNTHPHQGNVTFSGAQYVWIYGLTIVGSRNDSTVTQSPPSDSFAESGVTLQGGAGLGDRIVNCDISLARHCGIKEMGHGGSGFVIEGNVIHDCGFGGQDHGIYVPSSGVTIRGNAVFANTGYGIHLYVNPSGCKVYDNVCFGNGMAGVLLAGHDDVIAHNVSVANGISGLYLWRRLCTQNLIVGNVFQDNLKSEIILQDGGDGQSPPSGNDLADNQIFSLSHDLNSAAIALNVITGTRYDRVAFLDAGSHDFRLAPGGSAAAISKAWEPSDSVTLTTVGLFPATMYPSK